MRRALPTRPRRAASAKRRWPVWAFTLALVLQAATPWLAAAAASHAGVAVAEVCTVWGVRTVSLADVGPAPRDEHPGPAATHAAPCGLAGFVASEPSGAVGLEPHALAAASPVAVAGTAEAPIRDAAMRWAARLHHAPPLSA